MLSLGRSVAERMDPEPVTSSSDHEGAIKKMPIAASSSQRAGPGGASCYLEACFEGLKGL